MTDYISREDALNFEMEIEADPEEIQAISKGMALYGEYIKSIPVADVAERKRGEWIEEALCSTSGYGVYHVSRCSECRSAEPMLSRKNFCPNCGAQMESGDPDV